MRKVCLALVALACLMCAAPARAATIDFESFSDGDGLNTQISGLLFTDFTVLTAGVSLNEFDYPPVSGSNVAAGLNGNSSISFTNGISSFSASAIGSAVSCARSRGLLMTAVISSRRK